MILRGKLAGLMRDMRGSVVISFNVGEVPDVSYIEGKDLDIKVTQHREKRSLSQNAYYWTLLSKLAHKQNISTTRLHNLLLRDIGIPFIIDGQIAMQPIPDTETAENEILETDVFHLKPTGGIINSSNGAVYRWYIILRGSSTFSTDEMSVLLNRLIDECKENDIEVATPFELAQMKMYSEELERRKK